MTNLPPHTTVTTQRLRLEPFAPAHASALNAINNEPAVMEFLSEGVPETMERTQDAISRVRDAWAKLGYSWWAIIDRSTEEVIGAACAQHVARKPEAEIEIGWRLATATTGKGFATEAGRAAARYAFEVIDVDHVVAVAHPDNIASHKVMQRIGMTFRGIETHYDADCTTYVLNRTDFDT
ncbi:MAG: GNAT family N-acetyltransferase [Pseudomonadota bacterium]